MLFNKDANGSAELKALIGFIYKSINFDNLKRCLDIQVKHSQVRISTQMHKIWGVR